MQNLYDNIKKMRSEMRLQKRPPLWAPDIKEFAMGAPRVHFYPKTLIFTAHGQKTLILGCTRRAPTEGALCVHPKIKENCLRAVNIKVFGQNQGKRTISRFLARPDEEASG